MTRAQRGHARSRDFSCEIHEIISHPHRFSADFSQGIHRPFTFQTLLTSSHSDPILHDEIPELENVLFDVFNSSCVEIMESDELITGSPLLSVF